MKLDHERTGLGRPMTVLQSQGRMCDMRAPRDHENSQQFRHQLIAAPYRNIDPSTIKNQCTI